MDLGSHHGGHCPFLALESWGGGPSLALGTVSLTIPREKKKRRERICERNLGREKMAMEAGVLQQSRMIQKLMQYVLHPSPTTNPERSPRRNSRHRKKTISHRPASWDSNSYAVTAARLPLPPLTARDQVLGRGLGSDRLDSSPLPP